jgi:lipopolysaccharide/colanic/teichoic acid biosynthesis glycosyltransferase
MSAAGSSRGEPGYPLKRVIDLCCAAVAFVLTLPLLLLCMSAVWLSDRGNPFYVSERVGLRGRSFRFLKIRTMVPGASASGVDTTVHGDARITALGRWIRALKFDELPQFLHVLLGHMSMVGPRPNVPREVAIYTLEERGLLAVRPGITDIASIAFADLAEALINSTDPNIDYNQLVRPWKSRLGLHYIRCSSISNDLCIMFYTASGFVARRWTLGQLAGLLRRSGASEDLCRFVLRDQPLRPVPPPGADSIVTSRLRGEVD